MSKVTFPNEAEYQAAIDQAVNDALDKLRAQHKIEIDALNEVLAKAREANATADYSAFAAHPDLVELLKKTEMRPGGLPALCALHVWNGLRDAKSISDAIGTTPKVGDKGGVPSTPKIITAALQKLEKGLLTANVGIGIKVTSIRGKEGDSTVKRVKWTPMQFDADESADSTDSTDSAPSESADAGEQAEAA